MCVGLTLDVADPAVFQEVIDGLEARDFSPAGRIISGELSDAIVDQIRSAPIARRCSCGQGDCHSYIYNVSKKTHVQHFTVRLYVHGELLIHADDEGAVYSIERLNDEDSL